MPVKTIRQALQEALIHEMRRDPRVVVIGEDVSGGAGTEGGRDAAGGVLGVTKGLIKEFGESRIIDTPITESAIMGAAAGAAVTGLRPVAELMFSDFLGVCFDQIRDLRIHSVQIARFQQPCLRHSPAEMLQTIALIA